MSKKFLVTLEFDSKSDEINDPQQWALDGIFDIGVEHWFKSIKYVSHEVVLPPLFPGDFVINTVTGEYGYVDTTDDIRRIDGNGD